MKASHHGINPSQVARLPGRDLLPARNSQDPGNHGQGCPCHRGTGIPARHLLLPPTMDPETVERDYRARLSYRGVVAAKEGDHVIPHHIIDDEVRRGSSRAAFI